jgi:hypothetical protein
MMDAHYSYRAATVREPVTRDFLEAGTVSRKPVSNFIGCWRCDW